MLLAIRAALHYISKYSIKESFIFTDSLSLLYNLLNLKNYTNQQFQVYLLLYITYIVTTMM